MFKVFFALIFPCSFYLSYILEQPALMRLFWHRFSFKVLTEKSVSCVLVCERTCSHRQRGHCSCQEAGPAAPPQISAGLSSPPHPSIRPPARLSLTGSSPGSPAATFIHRLLQVLLHLPQVKKPAACRCVV